MSEQFKLVVHDPLQERQIRRLGAAICLLWPRLQQSVKEDIILQASLIHISGERKAPDQLQDQLRDFLETQVIQKA